MTIDPEVRTTAGVVRGRWEHAVAVFRGIPYAQPPVGARRFAAPVPAQPWDGCRDALKFGPPVPQAGSAVSGTSDSSRNCLTLNVWSPDLGAGLPVMVWIHGGAYLEGTSGNPHHDGATLARSGVVMVSLNYRVGVEGFAHIAGAPDNRGILDQAAALRWVQDNVAAFGGDPGNVTVFGQSAGAGCLAALMTMPLAAGLFQRAIAQSVPGTYFSTRLAAAISATIAGELGVQATVDELSRISPGALIDATDAVIQKMPGLVESWGPMALTPTPFSPVVDGDVLPHAPWRALAGGAGRGIDLLVGHTRDEYRLFTTRLASEVTAEQVTATLERLGPASDSHSVYRAAYPDASPGQLYEIVNSDWLFRMPSLHLAGARHAGGGRAWTYELCWSYNRDEGASHSLDVLLVFGTLSADEVRRHPSAVPNAADEVVSVAHHMRTDWLNFATTGNPGWKPYDPETRSTRVYTAEPITQPYPEEQSLCIWHTHRFDTLDLLHPE
ncbi:carboxylesterase/lipase family protein [Nocardia iowensis]|uniref:Carboxylic ester hydrolase n=1 Tax=Nocardia iowensis TaxID=204891 RepID=A0ABX8RGR3_NOCIO|nr:carboxylesterase family protein [Nocardia iowensis]QXN88082.1 carboxylesterase family protein [Nocardia iowensis]